MDYNRVEISVLLYLRPRLGHNVSSAELFAALKEKYPELKEETLLRTLNILAEEGLIRGSVSGSLAGFAVDGITGEGLKVLRTNYGAND